MPVREHGRGTLVFISLFFKLVTQEVAAGCIVRVDEVDFPKQSLGHRLSVRCATDSRRTTTMSKQAAAIFWISFLSGIAGLAVAYSLWVEPESTSLEVATDSGVAQDDVPVSEGGQGAFADESTGSDDFAVFGFMMSSDWLDPQLGLGMALLGLVAFWTAWHGAAVSMAAGTAATDAFYGLISATFHWGAFAIPIPAMFWFLLQPMPANLEELAAYSAVAAVGGWQLGFWLARPWAAKNVSLDAQ